MFFRYLANKNPKTLDTIGFALLAKMLIRYLKKANPYPNQTERSSKHGKIRQKQNTQREHGICGFDC